MVLLVGLLFVIIGGLDLNDHDDQPSAVILNDVIVIFIFVISVVNIASAGILAIVISTMDNEGSEREKKLADWLYHTSVGLMTCAVFCDVIKMTFGLDPALSTQDFYGNRTSSIVNKLK
ncbi:hypothetical protein MSG28_008510 [Choristoneura fumiferana]|uniref:Uncharacterized protein n=1 Tax=Choristoneura fumiferana TaxID=7141 RepID=A0ACC0J712_CHOFU|nr:hypothetical protein MSG28_008510 [Choristoneura fumiferana]